MVKFREWYNKNPTNKFIVWSFVVTLIILFATIYSLLPKLEGKKLFLSFDGPNNFNVNCLTSPANDYPKINITVTKLRTIDTYIGYLIEKIAQVNNTCSSNSSFFIYNRQVCYITIKAGPSAYVSISPCSAFHPPPTEEPLIVQLNDLYNESSTFSLLAYTKNFPACQIIEKIKVCPIFENKIWYDQCTDDTPITINYKGC